MMTSSPAPPPYPPLRLHELVAACMSAAWLAGEVIREVVADGVDLAMVNKAEDKYDPQTVADRRAQQRMVHALRALYPQLQIVGEEGELDAPEPRDQVHADVPSLLADVPLVVDDEQLTGDLDAQQLVVWMDPLDGTKMFAAKKYDEVSVLLGIAYRKRPIAGVMHLPFHGGKNGETLWGGPSLGVYKTTHRPGLQAGIHVRQERPAPAYPDRALHITTSGTPCALVDEALALLKPARVKYGGATGTMAMSVLTGESDAFFRFRNATKRWDICAIEPLLEALGGKLVDKHGRVYLYDPNDPEESDFDNAHGLIASMNDATHQLMQNTMEEIHVTRTLDGGFMTPQWLEQCVFPYGGRVVARRVVPGSIRKGKHSIVAKLEVDVLGSQSVVQTKHVFLKRYVQDELPPRGSRNWTRDLISYRCEARFYESVHPHLALLPSASISVIKPLHVQFRIDSTGCETGDGFLVLLENVVASTPLEPADRLTREDTQHALKYLAGLHAAAIQSPELLRQVKTYLWSSGTWWSFEKRGVDELRHAPFIWKRMLEAFYHEIEATGLAIDTALENLGERMVERAAYISDQLFGEPSDAYAPLKTLVHGDFKTGNLFFHADTREVTAFDWQWAGLGLGALDVANLLNTSVGIEALTDEEGLLRFYYDAFQQALGTGTVELETLYPFEAFTRHVDLATLEYARVLIANFWDDTTPASCAADAHKTNWGLGYRSVPHVLRLVHKLHHGLLRFAREQSAAVE